MELVGAELAVLVLVSSPPTIDVIWDPCPPLTYSISSHISIFLFFIRFFAVFFGMFSGKAVLDGAAGNTLNLNTVM